MSGSHTISLFSGKAFRMGLLCFLLAFYSFSARANCTTVNPAFTATPVSVCGTAVTNISFVNTSTGASATTAAYTWYHNGVLFASTTGLTAPPTFPVSTVGTHVFRLIVSDPTVPCSDTVNVNVVVHNQPNASFTFAPNNACAGTSVAFTNTSTGTQPSTTYSWNFGDGTPVSTTANPSHAFNAGGTYNVTLTMTNAAGCTSTASATVTVLPRPVVNITGDDGDGNTTNCLLPADPSTSETVTFTNTTTGAVSYSWNFGDGSPASTAVNPTHTYTSFGTYTVTMTATGANGCTATGTITVVFEKYVSSSLTLNITEYSGCTPHTLSTLTNLSVNANTYTWNFGDGTPPITTTSFTPPSHTYNTGGTYTITLTASNSCNTATATISPIIIVAGPVASFNPSTTLGCAPQTVTFTNTTTGASPANNFQWNMGNGNTYTNVTNPPAQVYTTPGTYTVTMIAGNACGHDTITRTIVVDVPPVASITSTPLEGCTPLVVSTVNNSVGTPISYNWFVDGFYAGSAATLPNQTFTAPPGNATQTHTISLTAFNHCGTSTDAETIIVHPQVVAQFTNGPLTFCAGGSVTFNSNSLGDMLTYSWDFGDGTTATTPGPHTITYPTAGTYPVTLTVTGFCGTSTLTRNVVVLPYPTASFTPSVSSGCAPLVVNFNNTSTTGATSYTWNFGAGATPATSTAYTPPAVTYNTPGTSTVTLTVNASGCTSTITAPITINPLPVTSFTVTPNNGCTPLTSTFNNTSPVVVGNTYAWNFGNGNTSTAQNPPAEIYTNATTADIVYNVQLTITTASGCSTTVSRPVTVHPLPVANFTAVPDTVCATTPVAFLNNSTGATTYSWNFGDGTPVVTTTSPSHPYTAAGNYTVQLIATTAFGCKDTITHDVYVDPIPTANFNFTTECLGDSTSFTDLSTGAVTNWQWNFGDASNSTQTNPAHLYAASGNYNVVLTVTNTAGCTHTLSRLVPVNSVPVANFTAPPTCLGQPTAFTDVSTGTPVSWLWDFGDGTATTTVHHPTHTFAATGTYTIQMIAYGGSGCSDTVSHTVTVTPIPTADFVFASACTHDTTFFISTSLGSPDTFTWNFGDGTTDNTNNPTPNHIYHTAGTYNVTLTAGYSASGCTHSITIPVQAFPRTVPSFSSNTPCLGASTNFNDLTTNTPLLWEWSFGDGSAVDSTQNPSHTYTTPGFYNVTLVTQNIHTCIDSITTTIQVFPLPTAGFSFDTVCANFASAFIDESTSAISWQWNFGDGSAISTSASTTHIFPTSGTYNVEQVVTNNVGCTDTISQNVTVNPNPVAAYNVSTACHTYPSIFTDASAGAIQWAWDFGDGTTDVLQNTTHIYPADGTYNTSLIVTNIFGCTDTLAQVATVLLQPQSAFSNTTVCAGQTVNFTDETTGAPTTWNWDFGDGTTASTIQNPNHVYALGGSYTITLITGNIAGCMDTLDMAINVFTVPVPNFTADTVCLFSITHFTDLSTDGALITDWYWDFDDGNNSFAQNPTYIFQAPGTYNVTLTVTNVNGCDSSITLPVFVNEIPVADFSADTACVGGPTSFTDLSTGAPTDWLWDFGDGTTSTTGPNVSHTYAAPGSYVVTLYVTGGGGVCFDQVFKVVTVSNTVTAGFTAQDTACVREFVPFTNISTTTSGTISSTTWDFGDGQTSTLSDPTHAFDMPGTYTVVLTVTQSGGCSSAFSQDILVVGNPTAMFVTSPACVGQMVNFTSLTATSGVPLENISWDFGDGNTGTGTNASHTYATQGTYNVELDVTSIAGCHDSVIVPIVIHPLPVANFNSSVVCLGDTVNFTDLSTVPSGIITGWSWDFGDGGTASVSSPEHIYTVHEDTFAVSLIVVTDMGCRDTIDREVYTLPIVDFSFIPETVNGCAPMSINFGDASTISGGSIVGWVWNFDDGNYSFQQSPVHVFPNDGTYYISLTVTTSDGCVYTDTLNFPITVYPQPVAGFNITPNNTSVYQPEVTFPDMSQGALYWEYDFGDNNYSNEASPSHYYTAPGTYDVMQIVTNGYGCSDTVTHPVYILEESTFYTPNAVTPNGDGLNEIFLPRGTGIVDYQLYIFDRWGELLFETKDIDQGWDCTFKGSFVKEDVYVWRAIITDINGDVNDYYGHFTVLR